MTTIKPSPMLLALRVEADCAADLIKQALHNELVSWTKEGCVITFQVRTLTLETLRWLLNKLPDCQVAAQTLEAAEHFTGERDSAFRATAPTGRQQYIAANCLGRASLRGSDLEARLAKEAKDAKDLAYKSQIAAARAQAAAAGWAKLDGSVAQCDWAETIRVELVNSEDVSAEVRTGLKFVTSAKDIIDFFLARQHLGRNTRAERTIRRVIDRTLDHAKRMVKIEEDN